MKQQTAVKWATFFGVTIIDPDGFRPDNIDLVKYDLKEFVERITSATISINDPSKYKFLDFLIKNL